MKLTQELIDLIAAEFKAREEEIEQLKEEKEWLIREIQCSNPQMHVGLSPDRICKRMQQALKGNK